MKPVHVYLAAWVVGGVLLGVSMMLDELRRNAPSRASGAHPDTLEQEPTAGPPEPSPRGAASTQPRGGHPRTLRVLPWGMIGFGLSGLTAKGLGFDSWPWTLVCAIAVGGLLIVLGYALSRVRAA